MYCLIVSFAGRFLVVLSYCFLSLVDFFLLSLVDFFLLSLDDFFSLSLVDYFSSFAGQFLSLTVLFVAAGQFVVAACLCDPVLMAAAAGLRRSARLAVSCTTRIR